MKSFDTVVAEYYRETRHCRGVGRDSGVVDTGAGVRLRARKPGKKSPLARLRARFPGRDSNKVPRGS